MPTRTTLLPALAQKLNFKAIEKAHLSVYKAGGLGPAATLVGDHLDNACSNRLDLHVIKEGYQELIVCLRFGHKNTIDINLSNLLEAVQTFQTQLLMHFAAEPNAPSYTHYTDFQEFFAPCFFHEPGECGLSHLCHIGSTPEAGHLSPAANIGEFARRSKHSPTSELPIAISFSRTQGSDTNPIIRTFYLSHIIYWALLGLSLQPPQAQS
jgi:hypothetical protein